MYWLLNSLGTINGPAFDRRMISMLALTYNTYIHTHIILFANTHMCVCVCKFVLC